MSRLLSYGADFTLAVLRTDSLAANQLEVVGSALGDKEYVLEEVDGKVRLQICWVEQGKWYEGREEMEAGFLCTCFFTLSGNGSYW